MPTQRLARLALLLIGVTALSACSLWAHPSDQSAPGPPPADEPGRSLGRISGAPAPGHEQAPTALNASPSQVPEATQAQAALCEDLRAQIRSALATARQAPATSIDENIVAAREAHAGQKLDQLRAQYDQEGCSSEKLPPSRDRVPLPPAAPGRLPP